jgi:hypothetical protein
MLWWNRKSRRARVLGRIAVPVGLSAALVLAGSPAWAGWDPNDLTERSGAPLATSAPMGYWTSLPNEDPHARVVYRTAEGHIEELSVTASTPWTPNDLTYFTDAPVAASAPSGQFNTLAPMPPTARVDYLTTNGHIEELFNEGEGWKPADLTQIAGAPPAASAPTAFTTYEQSSNPIGRLVYRTPEGRIEELEVTGSTPWVAIDLNSKTGAPTAASAPYGYYDPTTNGPRVLYTTDWGEVIDMDTASGRWTYTDLTATRPGTSPGVGTPAGYYSNLTTEGLTTRIAYRTTQGHIAEFTWNRNKLWSYDDLYVKTNAPLAGNDPFGYETRVSNDFGARVVYPTASGAIEALAVGPNLKWTVSQISSDPAAASRPSEYTTGSPINSGSVDRVIFETTAGDIEELSLAW